MNKIILSLAVSTMTLSLGVSSYAHARTLRVWDLMTDPDKTMVKWEDFVTKDFKKQTGANLKWFHKDSDIMKVALKVALKSNNPPDIYQNQAGTVAAEYINAGYALDITNWIKELKAKNYNKSSFYDAYGVYKGKNYGLTLNQLTKFMYYNKSLFKKYHLKVPKTFGDIINICKVMHKNHKGIISFGLGNKKKWRAINVVSQLNGYYVSPETIRADYIGYAPSSTIFTDPGYLKALKRFKSMSTNKCFERSPNTTGRGVISSLFNNNKSLMEYSGTWNNTNYTKGLGKNLGVVTRLPLPKDALIKDATEYNLSFSSGYMVYKNTKNKDLAKAFLTSLAKAKHIFYKIRYDDRIIKELETIKHPLISTDTYMQNAVSLNFLSDVQALIDGKMTPEQVIAHTRKTALKLKKEEKHKHKYRGVKNN